MLQIATELRNHTHPLLERGIDPESHPTSISIQIHSIEIEEEPFRVQLCHRNDQETISAIPYAKKVQFPLSFHKIMFDIIKVNVLRQQLITWKRQAQAVIKISDLEFVNDQVMSFPLLDSLSKRLRIGTITLKLEFDYQFVSLGLKMPYTSSPVQVTGIATPPASEISSDDSIDIMYQNFAEGLDSTSSVSSSTSVLSYSKRSRREGIEALSQLYASMSNTGWKISRIDFVRAMGVMQGFYKAHPTPKTHLIVENTTELKIAAYFMDFCNASYGAAALNFFGYGKLTDCLKLGQNKKAAIAHLKIDKKDMLLWQYDSHGLFCQKPCFYVVRCVESNSIVLCVRGTFGIGDTITDMNAEYAPFMGGTGHSGCIQGALWIRDHYGDQIKSWIREYKTTGFFLAGHSLGGAIASVLLMLMREELLAEFGIDFAVSAYTFATPPCVSPEIAQSPLFKPYIHNFVNEYDPVPKCSFGAFMDFKEMISLAAKLSRETSMTKTEKFQKLSALQLDLRKKNTYPRLISPGQIYLMYKTSRINPETKKKDFKGHSTGNPLIDDSRPHYVVERSIPEYFDTLDIRSDMMFLHLLNKYDHSLRASIDYLEENK